LVAVLLLLLCVLRLQHLTCSGQLSYLGTSWRKDVAFAGYGVPLQVSAAAVTRGSGCCYRAMQDV
jgi:hypothetical protein